VEGNALFVFVNCIYLTSVLAFSISHPWRKEFFTNVPFVVVTVLALVFNVLVCMVEQVDWSEFNLIHLVTTNVRLYLLIASIGFSVVIYVTQKCILEPLANRIIRKYPKIKWI
jgi:magnesium-transporting ATPase (P-type)